MGDVVVLVVAVFGRGNSGANARANAVAYRVQVASTDRFSPLLADIRILASVLIGLLGLAFLAHASPRSWPYVRWLAGSAVALVAG